jgi:2-oxoglutarate ferredoxin oxidoreductase subunit beta
MAVTIANPKNLVYSRPKGFTDTPTHYCPGCTHGTAHRLVAEVLEEMNVLERTIGVAPVGCAVFAYHYFDLDFVEAAHGRAPAMATGIKLEWLRPSMLRRAGKISQSSSSTMPFMA